MNCDIVKVSAYGVGYNVEILPEETLLKFNPKVIGEYIEGEIVNIFEMGKYKKHTQGYIIKNGEGVRVLFTCGGVVFERLCGDRLTVGTLVGITYMGRGADNADGKHPCRLWGIEIFTPQEKNY